MNTTHEIKHGEAIVAECNDALLKVYPNVVILCSGNPTDEESNITPFLVRSSGNVFANTEMARQFVKEKL